jgi:hypothetical protein
MAKEIKTILKLQIPAGAANPASSRLLGTPKKPLGFLRIFDKSKILFSSTGKLPFSRPLSHRIYFLGQK